MKELKWIGTSRVECCRCHRRFEIEDYGELYIVEIEDRKIEYKNRRDVRCPICNSKEIF